MQNKLIKTDDAQFSSTSKALAATAAAGIIGVGAALLLMPKSKIQPIKEAGHKALEEVNNEQSTTPLLIGALAGSVLGATFVYYISNKEEPLTDAIGQKIKEAGKSVASQASEWIETAKDVVDNIHDKVHQFDDKAEKKMEEASSRVEDFVEWAQLGLRVWNNLKKRS